MTVDIAGAADETRFRDLLEAYHYLGTVPGMGETMRYVAHCRRRWLALLVFSAPALKCGARDRWIGWDCVDSIMAIAHMKPTSSPAAAVIATVLRFPRAVSAR